MEIIMKKFLLMLPILFALSTEANAEVEFRIIPVQEVTKGIGVFVLDTGKKVFEGAATTACGLGEILTAPFRARTYKPKSRLYYYQRPQMGIYYDSGRLYRANHR
tara:strand:- start:1916 stop:2230 length:315 start_codon:yes stop_codon:yes gene_type:complete